MRNFITCIFLLVACSNRISAQVGDSLATDTVIYTSIEEALKNPDQVYKLELRKKKLKTFPLEIFKFKNLEYLDLAKNSIKELPVEIGNLSGLKSLNLSKNDLESLPAEIGKLTNLEYLNVNQNELYSLPREIGELVNLTKLDLWSNNIEKFPQELGYLKNLKVLDLRAILIPDEEQLRLREMLPGAKIHFDPYCKCQQ